MSAGNDFGSFSVNQNVAIKANVFFYIFYTGGGGKCPLAENNGQYSLHFSRCISRIKS